MKIRYVAPSPKAGTEEHIENTAGTALCRAGFAEEIKYANYRERLASEFSPRAVPPVVSWGISEATSSASLPAIIRREGANTVYYASYEGLADCPVSIRQRFEALLNPPPNNLERAKREQAEYIERIKTAKRY